MGSSGQKSHKSRQIERQDRDLAAVTPQEELSKLQKAVIELYGRGFRRGEVARKLMKYLCPSPSYGDGSEAARERQARAKLRRWEQKPWFRDALFQRAVVDTDLATTDIMKGVTKRAKEGNVDAAKFAMEVSGRYTPKGDTAAAQVTVVFSGLPRPLARQPQAIEGEAEEMGEAER